LAYIDTELSEPGTRVAVEILDEKRPATVVPTPYYDAKNTKVRA
jgi:glycine cleavage system aminomethyltransferase T